jgi:hypothetical protein
MGDVAGGIQALIVGVGFPVDTYVPESTAAGAHRGHTLRDPSGIDENCRDLNSRSSCIRTMFGMVRNMPARDPAYRPAHLIMPLTCGMAMSRGQSGHIR